MYTNFTFVERVTVPEMVALWTVPTVSAVTALAISSAAEGIPTASIEDTIARLDNQNTYYNFLADHAKTPAKAASLRAEIVADNHSIAVAQANLNSGNYSPMVAEVNGLSALTLGAAVVLAVMGGRRVRYRRKANTLLGEAAITVSLAEQDNSL